jgi:hypothetical protein
LPPIVAGRDEQHREGHLREGNDEEVAAGREREAVNAHHRDDSQDRDRPVELEPAREHPADAEGRHHARGEGSEHRG